MTCDHTEGTLKAFIELRETDSGWNAIGFFTDRVHPEIAVLDAEYPCEALIEAGHSLGMDVEIAGAGE